jgi:hypothetical protein
LENFLIVFEKLPILQLFYHLQNEKYL